MFTMLTILLILYISPNNIITILIAIEILLLIVTIKLIYLAGYFDDIHGIIIILYIIILAGTETTIGLSLLISYYNLRGKITNIL